MSDKRTHRGKHPQDERLFAPDQWPILRHAVCDLSWLLSNGYADKSSLKLVGDRFNLTQRQRLALMRCVCSDKDLHNRLQKLIGPDELQGQPLLLDGYNIITTIETALSGGVVLKARDCSFRDIAGVHGTYRKVSETIPALKIIGGFLAQIGPGDCHWYLDRPVSNSGRLKTIILQIADEQNWPWFVELVRNPDTILSQADDAVATSDSIVLNLCGHWFNLASLVIENKIPDAFVVDLSIALIDNET